MQSDIVADIQAKLDDLDNDTDIYSNHCDDMRYYLFLEKLVNIFDNILHAFFTPVPLVFPLWGRSFYRRWPPDIAVLAGTCGDWWAPFPPCGVVDKKKTLLQCSMLI